VAKQAAEDGKVSAINALVSAGASVFSPGKVLFS
jgi:hypothetical protein